MAVHGTAKSRNYPQLLLFCRCYFWFL